MEILIKVLLAVNILGFLLILVALVFLERRLLQVLARMEELLNTRRQKQV